jgi:hypothetical protein
VVKLSIAIPDPIPGRRPALPLPLTLINGKEEFKVEAILNSQMRYNHLEYLVKWKGYEDGHNSWQVHHQFHTQAKVPKFHRKNPEAAHYINAAIFNSIPFTQVDLATNWRSSRIMMLCL